VVLYNVLIFICVLGNMWALDNFIIGILTLVPIMLAVAIFTLTERKVMGAIQRRRGPNVVGFWGILQPIADGLKLFLKEIILPSKSNKLCFLAAPIITLFLSLFSWSCIPFNSANVIGDMNLGILYILALSSLGIYGIIIAGWSSNSRYAFFGALRSVAQMVSYEISIGLIILPVIICSGTFNLINIVLKQQKNWYFLPLMPLCFLFLISILAETNRAPFDLPEAEAEIVAGYNVEYSSITFALFFLGEYSNILLMASLYIILFFGGWLPVVFLPYVPLELWFSLKITTIVFIFILIRANYPRVRYDQLMSFGWKLFLPLTFGYLIFICGFLVAFNGLPFSNFTFYNL
jgi:NADH-quinone oxidoreductase subunit H